MTRRTAKLAWAATLVVPFAFAAVARGVARAPALAAPREPLFWLAVAACVANVLLALALPPRLGPARASDRDAVAFTRVLVSLALAEAAALAPLVAYMLTRDARLLALGAAAVAALAVLCPSDRRWAALLPAPESGPGPRAEVR